MTSAQTPSPATPSPAATSMSLARKIALCVGGVLLVLILALLALRVFVTTASGHRFIENQINARSFGPIESVTVSGVAGDPLGDMRIASLAVKDKDGAWLTAQDITVNWSPLSLLSRHIKIDTARANRMTVLRKPTLNPSEGGGSLPRISAPHLSIATLSIEPAVMGQSAQFSFDAGVTTRGGSANIDMTLTRTDITGEVLDLTLTRSKDADINGTFALLAPSGGPIATLLRAPDGQDVRGEGNISGTQALGAGQISLRVGESEAVQAQVNWTDEKADMTATIAWRAWPEFSALSDALGETLSLDGELDRTPAEQPFVITLRSDRANATAQGVLPDGGVMPARAALSAELENPAALGILPDGYSVGPATIMGDFSTEPMAFDGRATLAAPRTPYGEAGRVSGPITLSKDGDKGFSFDTTLTAQDLTLTQALPLALQSRAVLAASGRYDSAAQKLSLSRAKLSSGAQSATASGTVSRAPLRYALSGAVDMRLDPIGAIGAGALSAEYRVIQKSSADEALSVPALTTTGRFTPIDSFAAPLADLLGGAVTFEAQMQPIDGGVSISQARMSGNHLRAALEGTITDRIDLSAEALTTRAFSHASVDIGERAEVTLRVDGPRRDPNVKLQSEISTISTAGQTLNGLTLKADIADVLIAPNGAVMLNANSEYGAVKAQAQLSSKGRDVTIADLSLSVGDVAATGDLLYSERGLFTGELALNLPESDDSYARAALRLSEGNTGMQGLQATIDARNISYDAYEIDSMSARASGTLSNLAGEIAVKGRRNVGAFARPIEVNAPFDMTRDESGIILAEITPEGRYASLDFAPSAPVRLRVDGPSLMLTAPMTVTGQPVDLYYARQASEVGVTQESLRLSAENLPVSLFPLPGDLADSRGRVSVDANFESGSAAALSGQAVVTLNDWRGFGVDAGEGLDMTMTATAAPRAVNTVLRGQSTSGFVINGDLSVPITTGRAFSTVRPNMQGAIAGQFKASGPAKAVLGLITPPTADLGGQVDVSVDISGSLDAPKVVGRAGGQALQFETPQLGTQIRNGRFSARFNNTQLSVTDIYFIDAKDGVAKGQGDFTLGELGRPIGQISLSTTKFNVIDRRDMSARISGSARYESLAKSATISGVINVGEAEVKQITAGSNASVIEIAVEEINRPDGLNQAIEISRPSFPTNLDIKVRAPRRIFVRSKGLDVELSADVTVTGTVDNPVITGVAEVERGGYKIAGKELRFSEGSVEFDGPLASARVLLKASAQTSNLTASVEISGTVSDPEIELSSSPDRPDDEILSALLFGRSATELSAIEAAQLAGALAQFSGNGIGFDLLGGLRESLGIGQLSVGVSEDGNAQITGGRYLAPNVYLQVFSGVGADQTGAIIDWELRKNVSLRSRIQADNEQSLSLSYKRDF